MDKTSLRKSFLSARKSLPSLEIKSRNQLIHQRLMHFIPWHQLNVIHLYLPVPENHEVDTLPIIQNIRNNHKTVKIAVPKVEGNKLDHFLLSENTRLETNIWGIPEPVGASLVPIDQIDLVIVPMIIFDKMGHRIGYGKGYYDRFLSQCRRTTQKVGLCYFNPADPIEPEPTDVPMDAVITPEGIWEFGWLRTKGLKD